MLYINEAIAKIQTGQIKIYESKHFRFTHVWFGSNSFEVVLLQFGLDDFCVASKNFIEIEDIQKNSFYIIKSKILR